jgi:hypothetical protein
MVILIIITCAKLYFLGNNQLYVLIQNTFIGDIVFDCTETLTNSPRILALFTFSYLNGSTYIGDTHRSHSVR